MTTTDPTTPAPEMTAPTMLLLDKHKLQVAIGEFVYQRFQCGQERALAEAEGFMRHIPDSAYVANAYAAAERPAEGMVDTITIDRMEAAKVAAMFDPGHEDHPRPGPALRMWGLLNAALREATALAASSAEPDAAPEQGEGK